jgi:hypothetical protein
MKKSATICVWVLVVAAWSAVSAVACTTPLIFDLTGDGIRTLPPEGGVHFDIDSDGIVELTGWTDPASNDAFLALDLNRNGTIDSGLELFGNRTRMPGGRFASNGFEALSVYDRPESGGDGDGLITAADSVWQRLRLWQDKNYNGRSEEGEVLSLDAASVVGIALRYETALEYDDAFNLHQFQGFFFRAIWPVLDIRPESERLNPALRTQDVHDVWFRVFDPNGL